MFSRLDGTAIFDQFNVLVDEARSSRGTEHAHAVLHTVRGALLRQTGPQEIAYEDLSWAVQNQGYLDDGDATHARVQLALICFDAGLWDEAAQLAEAAASEVLAESEGPLSMVAYGLAALIPAARGQLGAWSRVLDVVANSSIRHGQMGQHGRTAALIWGAFARVDFEDAAALLLKPRREPAFWRDALTSAVLTARAEYYCGRAAAGRAQLAELEGIPGGPPSLRSFAGDYIHGLIKSGLGDPEGIGLLYSALETIGAERAQLRIRAPGPTGSGCPPNYPLGSVMRLRRNWLP
ncbi:hypothetical protein HGQ17_09545 [Nesterenkonia sp. MY13]|uniref:Uncharacterized protein n=1 Tax=Nesterenkonia sedimenti TaxID=1463632 RepID=A0A7X8TKH1_9MICC|nr:hypothetical protein [Nesterenkonia sedimenti]NLS10231.1 hypothetical protein [Nesterenkonia sedimenti]